MVTDDSLDCFCLNGIFCFWSVKVFLSSTSTVIQDWWLPIKEQDVLSKLLELDLIGNRLEAVLFHYSSSVFFFLEHLWKWLCYKSRWASVPLPEIFCLFCFFWRPRTITAAAWQTFSTRSKKVICIFIWWECWSWVVTSTLRVLKWYADIYNHGLQHQFLKHSQAFHLQKFCKIPGNRK